MNAEQHYKSGQDKASNNDWKGAIESLTKAIEGDPKNPFFYNERAVCYLNLEQYDLSLFDMNKSVDLAPNYAYFYTSRGFLKARMQDMQGCVEDYEKSLELDPKNEITYNNLGLALEQIGNMTRAQRVFAEGNKVLGYDPKKRLENQKEAAESASIDEAAKTKQSKSQVAKDVFTKKSTFKEFMSFLGNGFKLKKDDKS